MTSNGAGSYEDTRQRHFAYLMSLMPEFLARLRWSRAEIDAEQTRALRDLVSHAAHLLRGIANASDGWIAIA